MPASMLAQMGMKGGGLPGSRGPNGQPLLSPTPGMANARFDNEGRPFDLTRVVVNFANVGMKFGSTCLRRKHGDRLPMFDYEGVRRCVRHMTEKLGLICVGVIFENYRASDFGAANPCEIWKCPEDIEAMCESVELAPRLAGQQHKSADDEMTIKCAYNRNCRFLDNDNYADWRKAMGASNIKVWLEKCQEFLQQRFYFDTGLGTFDTLDGNIEGGPAPMVPGNVQVQKRKGPTSRCF